MAESHNFARLKFDIRWSTFKFILLNVATLGFITWIWMWKLANRTGSENEQDGNRVLALLFYSFSAWCMAFSYSDDEFSSLLAFGFNITSLVLLEVLSFKVKALLEKMLVQADCPIRMKGLWCFLFPFWYHYYIIYNAEDISGKIKGIAPQQNNSENSINLDKS